MSAITFPSGETIDFGEMSPEEMEPIIAQLQQEKPEMFAMPDSSQGVGEEAGTEEDLSVSQIFDRADSQKSKPTDTPEIQVTNKGEIKDHSFQFWYGRADNDSDREARLTQEFGPEGFIKIASDDYALDLDKISPEKKQEYDLPKNGTIRVNQPGLSWYDVSGTLGAEAVPLTAALGAGLMFSGVGVIPGALLQAAAGAAGKAIDELVFEKMEGLQTQSDEQIYGDIVTTGALYGAGELVGRGAFAVGRRLLKGPGPKPDSVRVAQLEATGLSNKEARRNATEEVKNQLREAVNKKGPDGKSAGARPTVEQVSGKSIQGRVQAIYEGIFPNPEAAAKNRVFVDNTLKSLAKGDVTEAEAKAILNDNAEAVTVLISNAMKNANPEQAAKLAEQHLTKVIDNEFKLITDLYNPNTGLTTNWQQGLNQVARLFDQDSSTLYGKAEDILGKITDDQGNNLLSFENTKLLNLMEGIQSDKITSATLGDTFSKGLFEYIKKTPNFSLTELNSLRSALRMSGKDPSLTPGILDRHIGEMVKSIDETIAEKLASLASLRVPKVKGKGFVVAKTTDTGEPLYGATETLMDEGIRAFQLAQNLHARGISRFKQGAVEMLDKNIKQGFLFGEKPILETIVQPGNATQLNAYLKAVTPSGRSIGGITSVSPVVFDEAAALAIKGDMKGAVGILKAEGGLDDVIPKLPDFINDLKPTDPYVIDIAKQFAGQMRNYSRLASNRSTPLEFRNGIRDNIAKEWLSQANRTSQRLGRFDSVSFVQKFDELGADVQKVLFGKENAEAIRSLTRDYLMLGRPTKELSEAIAETLGSTASAIRAKAEGLSGGLSIKNQLSQLKEISKVAQEQSEDALFQAVKNGRIQNADDLVGALLKNPKNYDKLKKVIGEGGLDNPNNINLKDMVMARILSTSFPEGVTGDAVTSGSWGRPLRQTIAKLNRNGSVSKIIGQDTVNDLIKASKIGERISDAAFAGKAGLAPATFAATAGVKFLQAPLNLLGKASGIYFLGRVFRQKWYLNSLLKPNYGGRRMYQKGIAAGADLGKANPVVMELKERINQQARLIASASMAPDSDTREQVSQVTTEISNQARPVIQQAGQVVQQAMQQPAPMAPQPAPPVQGPPTTVPQPAPAPVNAGPPIPDYLRQGPGPVNPLYQAEINKLLGVSP